MAVAPTPPIYHERQQLSRCSVHAVNNLLGGPVYSARDFDAICEELNPSRMANPHRDTEPPPPTGVLAGLLVHTTHAGASRLWGLFGTTPHWLAVRLLQVAGVWRRVVLDSTAPLRVLGAGVGAGSVHEFVAGVLAGGGHVLVVHRLDVVPP
ncbi:hypothetical protein I4F81_011379 [Pyropia yezoensis]|uniref:Uncharacterized protein n=1 Tax=Pyropia yezoensis TaxID=2788 RepID=A0ACC3CFB7_PYRYE|nr:hypothetical protein I4F81_011379 [Neopyropia yezoensis]